MIRKTVKVVALEDIDLGYKSMTAGDTYLLSPAVVEALLESNKVVLFENYKPKPKRGRPKKVKSK